ncbi:MAG: hypothetical protein ACK4YF_07765 [Exilispira sp.]
MQEAIYFGNKFQNSIFITGKYFIGTHVGNYELSIYSKIPLATVFLYILCTFVAIGEESLFKGFLYEEHEATIKIFYKKIFADIYNWSFI